jgi:hypothetical protein
MIEVLEIAPVNHRSVVVALAIEGDIQQGMILEQCPVGARFRVLGVGFTPADGHAAGKRAITLESLDGGCVRVGDRLQVADVMVE